MRVYICYWFDYNIPHPNSISGKVIHIRAETKISGVGQRPRSLSIPYIYIYTH